MRVGGREGRKLGNVFRPISVLHSVDEFAQVQHKCIQNGTNIYGHCIILHNNLPARTPCDKGMMSS